MPANGLIWRPTAGRRARLMAMGLQCCQLTNASFGTSVYVPVVFCQWMHRWPLPMSVRADRGGWEVRWLDGSGRKRAKRFRGRAGRTPLRRSGRRSRPSGAPSGYGDLRGPRGGVYPYATAQGTRWRYVIRRSDGKADEQAWLHPAKGPPVTPAGVVVERVERGEPPMHTDPHLWRAGGRAGFARRKPYLEPNSWRAYDVDGRKRLLPEFKDIRLPDHLDVEHVREWMERQGEAVEAGRVAAEDRQQHSGHPRHV